MIFGEHQFGLFGQMMVSPVDGALGQGLILVQIGTGGVDVYGDGEITHPEDEILARADVERLRDLLNEALS